MEDTLTKMIIPKHFIKRVKLFLISIWLRCILLVFFIVLYVVIYSVHDSKVLNQIQYREADSAYAYLLTKLSLVDYRNFTNLQAFMQTDFHSIFFHSDNVTFLFMGSLRFIQYQFSLPDFCYDNKSLLRYQTDCNPYFNQGLSEFAADTINPPLNISNCIQKACSEFILNGQANVQTVTKWNSNFPASAFTVDINTEDGDNFLLDLDKVFQNQWINENNTRVLIVDFNIIEEFYDTVFKYELIFEKPGGEMNDIVLLTPKKYVVNHYFHEDVVMELFIPIYFVVTMLYFLKIIFLYNYTQNLALFLDLCMVIVDLNFLISYITEYSEYIKLFGLDLNSIFINKSQIQNKFYNMSTLKIWASYRLFMVFLESIVLFLRLLQLFGTITNFAFYNKFVNSIFRSFMALFKCVFCLIFILIGWSLGIYQIMREIDINFQTVAHSLLSFFVLDDINLSNREFFQKFSNSDNPLFYLSCWLTFFVMKLTIFGYFLSIISFAIKKANSFEYESCDARDNNIKDCVNQITKKIEKFSKSYLNHLEGEMLTTNKKIIIWLDNNLLTENQYLELNNLANKENINLIPFFEPQQILDFLQFLFRLKPNLMYKSGNLFRILIENNEKSNDVLKNYDLNFTKLILNWLRGVGCRVPVCFFMKIKVKENDLMIIKKIYPNIVLSETFEDVGNFCCMKPLNNFLRKVYEKDESSFVSESEESRLMGKFEE